MVLICLAAAATGCGRSPWEALPLGTKADFRDIYFTDAQNGWIAGGGYDITGGLIGHTSDGGKTWRFKSNLTQRERLSVSAIRFFDTANGIAATSSGLILSTSDEGETWAPVASNGRASGISTVFILEERRGWAAGIGHVMYADDATERWTSLTPPNVDVAYRSPIRALKFFDRREGFLAGMHASLARTADGGATWEPIATPLTGTTKPNFWDMTFADRQTGWVVGEEGTILATTDGGDTWLRQRTGLKDAQSAPKLERIPTAGGSVTIDAGDRTPGITLSAVRFLDRNRGWMTGFYAKYGRSLILRTEDGGATWQVDAEIQGEELYALFLQGQETVWAVGARTREGPQAIYRRAVVSK